MTPKRILIVDDDLLGSSITREVLKSEGYEVSAVVSGDKALAALDAEAPPDLILMDIDLGPGRMDGTEAARRIMARADVPIVFLSAHSDKETIAGARTVAKYGFVQKVPGNEMFLLATVEMALELHETQAKRRRDAEVLRQSEALYRSLTELLPESVIKAGLDGSIQFANRNAAELHGFADPAAMVGTQLFDLVASEARPLTDERFRSDLENGGRFRRVETTLLAKDGRKFAAEVSAVLVPDGEGRPEAFLTVARDVSERKNAADEIIRNREALVEAQRVSGIGHWDYDPAAGVLEWSEEVFRIFGLDPAAGIDRRRFLDAIHPEDRELFESEVAQGLPDRSDYRIQTPAGEVRFVHNEYRRILDDQGRDVRLHGTVQDVTERKIIERSLRESERRLATLMANVPGLIYRCRNDTDWSMEFLSEGCLELTGYEPAELLANASVSFNEVIVPEDRERNRAEVQAAAVAGRDFRVVYRIRKKTGEIRWVSERGRGVDRPDGRAEAFEGIILDITDRRKADELVEKGSQEKTILLKELQHRVKNNLAVISSLLNLESERLHDPRDREIFRMMRNRIRSMALIYERLYRSDDVRAVDARGYLEGLAKQLFESNLLRPGQIRLNLHFDSFPLDLRKAVSCGLIFTELIANSLKHAFPGGRKGTLEVSAVKKGEGFVLAVKDDGIGFDPDPAGREGDGFGLKLLRSQVDQMKGVLKIESRPGSLFEIEVPIN